MSWWSDFVTATTTLITGSGTVGEVAGTQTPNSLLGAVGLGFLGALTDAGFWRSLGWLFLGLLLFGIGLLLILRAPIERGVGEVAKAVAL